LVRYLCRRPLVNADFDPVERGISVENKWRAQRYGVEATFASSSGAISTTEMLQDMSSREHRTGAGRGRRAARADGQNSDGQDGAIPPGGAMSINQRHW
jgi:hypothetical protein